MALLPDDAWLTMPPVTHEYQGPLAIASFLRYWAASRGTRRFRLVPTRANTQPAFGLYLSYLSDQHAPVAHAAGLIVLTLHDDRIAAAITATPATSRRNQTRPRRPAMMTGVSASTVRPGTRLAARILILAAIAAGGAAIWYRHTYNVWPGQGASARVHWCGRDYENFGGPPQTWRQIASPQRLPVRPVGQYPPLGWSRQDLFAATIPAAQRASINPPPPCTMIVYLRTGPGHYQPYSLEGGP